MPLTEIEGRQVEKMLVRLFEVRLAPLLQRAVKTCEDLAEQNRVLAQGCVALHEQNVALRKASIREAGK